MTLLLADLPSPQYWAAVAGAVITAGMTAWGVNYGIWKKHRTDADVEAFKRLEDAQKGSSLRSIQELTERIALLTDQIIQKERRIVEAEREKDAAKAEADRIRDIAMNMIENALEKQEFIRHADDPPPSLEAPPCEP